MQPQWSSGIPLKIWSLQVRPWTLNSFWIVWLILLSIEILRRRPRSASQTQYNRQNYQLPKETVCSHLFFKISCWGRSASGLARRDREKLFFLSMILSESIRQIFIFNSLFFKKKILSIKISKLSFTSSYANRRQTNTPIGIGKSLSTLYSTVQARLH